MPSAAQAQDLPEVQPSHGGTRRPRLLVAAARHGMADYRRQRDLPRLIGTGVPPGAVIGRLAEVEDALEQARLAGDPAWSCLRHVEVLIALLAERAMRAE